MNFFRRKHKKAPVSHKSAGSPDTFTSPLTKSGLHQYSALDCAKEGACQECGAFTKPRSNTAYKDNPEILPWLHKEGCKHHPHSDPERKLVRQVYHKLNATSSELRVLRLLPHEENLDICCELQTHQLDSCVPYEALSYYWGHLDSAPPYFVTLNGHIWRVTENLWRALFRLQRSSSVRILWVDALCINQSDVSERTHQVQMMGKIYSHAQHTIVWLGELSLDGNGGLLVVEESVVFDGTDSDRALVREFEEENIAFDPAGQDSTPSTFESGKTCWCCRDQAIYDTLEDKHYVSALCFLYHLHQDEHLKDLPYVRRRNDDALEYATIWQSTLLALNAIMLFPWWERIWVVQEVQLSTKAVVQMGRFRFPFDLLRSTFPWNKKHRFDCCADVFARFPFLQQKALKAMMEKTKSFEESGDIAFENLTTPVVRYCARKASEPKDMIFGVMGLLSDRYQNHLKSLSPGIPDYSLTTQQTFKHAMFIMLQEHIGARLLVFAQNSTSEALSLPSWVPAWSSIDDYARGRSIRTLAYNASGDLAKTPSSAGDFLAVANYGVGHIQKVGPVMRDTTNGIKIMEVLTEWQSLVGIKGPEKKHNTPRNCTFYNRGSCTQSTVDDRREAFLRTLIENIVALRPNETQSFSTADADDLEKLGDLLAWGETHPERFQVDLVDEEFAQVYQFLMAITFNRRFFITSEGFYGLGPPETSVGDEVRIIFGSTVPFVVRPVHSLFIWRHACCGHCSLKHDHYLDSSHLAADSSPISPHQSYLHECKRKCLRMRQDHGQDTKQPYADFVSLFLSHWMASPFHSGRTRFSNEAALRKRAFQLGMETEALQGNPLKQGNFTHKLIGSCYLHGIMDGEALKEYKTSLDENILNPQPTKYDRIIVG